MYTILLSKDFDVGAEEMNNRWEDVEEELQRAMVQKEQVQESMEESDDGRLFPDQFMVFVNGVLTDYVIIRFEYVAWECKLGR